ncbi:MULTISPECIES: amidohydrolase family protein [unclassified Polaribacter]|uniref:amidohydrolase family protein n=1 Tax=unclassified Polaribacter TaxID=196858 RepID=UPI0011BE16A4|nr:MULTISPECIES: amidohydrolase family protein [unclassified Polaribacter]TXD52545.1 amidohydrolase family protein [Polaribacter sp. IC063]TXD60531.1 amidohydrolase family protein [Polaribacter sp. IC066]
MKNILYSLLFFFCIGNSIAQQTPANKQSTAVSIEGATAHLGNGQVIKNSLIMFADGKITFVGSAMAKIARQGTVIKAEGKHVYPGFIAANASLGLVEIDAVKASADLDEIGINNPHIRSLIAYNAESKVVESMRPNGVLMAQITPRGGTISGTSSIVQLDAWNWEDAAVKIDDAIHMNWPGSFARGRWWLGEDPGLKVDVKYGENIEKIKSYFTDAKNYLASNKEKKHLPYEATKGLFNGSQKLFIHVTGQREITDAITIAKEVGIDNLVIVRGDGADKVADLLVKHNIPVILNRPHRNSDNEDDAYDYTYTIAKILTDKGVLVSIGMEGQMERMNTRNLPFYAGTFAAHGLDKEVALQLLTSNTAKILGIDDMVGSLEVGKHATLFISEGDALDMRGNLLTKAYIQGRDISLETHQTELYKRYSDKYKTK